MKFPGATPYSPEKMKKGIPILLEANLEFGDLKVYADVLTKVEELSSQRKYNYTPTLVVGIHKINKEQKFQLAFIGHVLSKFQKVKPTIGIIVGCGDKKHKIRLESLYKEVEQILRKLRSWISSSVQEAPPIILNKYCPYCQFQKMCEVKAAEQNYLSLLKGMNEKEVLAQNKKGIFTVTQLSYTYRPRKRRKGKNIQPPKYYPSLRALAIRDEKIYVVKKPEIPQSCTQIYLDVEGIPDQDYYYLIGLVITDEISTKSFSFWADNQDEEEKIWNKFVYLIKNYRDFTLFHYGSYEIKFIEKMSKKYGRKEDENIIKHLSSNLVNALSLIYANIYFPTYSNSLKDIGIYLGEKWSEENATGLQSLVWRYNWSETSDGLLKKKLITYNMEDCFALKKVIEVIGHILAYPEGGISNVVSTNNLKQKSPYNFGKNHFLFDDLDIVNKSAYFDYQREKVFFREKRKVVKQKSIETITGNKKYRINKHIEIALPRKCYIRTLSYQPFTPCTTDLLQQSLCC